MYTVCLGYSSVGGVLGFEPQGSGFDPMPLSTQGVNTENCKVKYWELRIEIIKPPIFASSNKGVTIATYMSMDMFFRLFKYCGDKFCRMANHYTRSTSHAPVRVGVNNSHTRDKSQKIREFVLLTFVRRSIVKL